MHINRIILLLLALLTITSCSSSNTNQQIDNNTDTNGITEDITTVDDTSLEDNSILSSVNNWEEMAEMMTSGYWLVCQKDEFGGAETYITKVGLLNFGSESDGNYCNTEEMNKSHGKGISFISYDDKSSEFKSYGNDYELTEDDASNKKVALDNITCSGFGCDMSLDYSKMEEGILYSIGECNAAENIPFDREKTFYFYETLEEAKQANENFSFGEIEVITDEVNVRSEPWMDFLSKERYEKVGEVKQGEKYTVYAISDYKTNMNDYIWHKIGKNRWVADDGTWLKSTPSEFKYR